ncbi:MAG: hypothetical protein IT257_07355 [Chitinophagaceae bacterium]|nr:hypothetical protein [Chitinophagaceae bacterium]
MITQQKMLQFREHILQNEHFFSSYNTAIEWASNYNELKKERFSIADHFRMLIIKNKWGRQSGYAFLSFISEDYALTGLMNNEIKEALDDLESRILGRCEPALIIRFYQDPADSSQLANYVRSEAWLNETYFEN